jgi:AsmA family protein
MKKFLKITGILLGLIVLVAIGGGAYLSTMDFNQYKGLVAEQAKAATGRDLKIEGDLNLEISLTPRLSVEGVSFANAAWGSRTQMVTVKKFAAEISLVPLLSGSIKVNQVILEGVDLLAEKDKSGKANWELGAPQKTAAVPAAEGGPAALPVVNNVSIKDVKITYKDAQAGQDYALKLDTVTFKADGVDAPLQLQKFVHLFSFS